MADDNNVLFDQISKRLEALKGLRAHNADKNIHTELEKKRRGSARLYEMGGDDERDFSPTG